VIPGLNTLGLKKKRVTKESFFLGLYLIFEKIIVKTILVVLYNPCPKNHNLRFGFFGIEELLGLGTS